MEKLNIIQDFLDLLSKKTGMSVNKKFTFHQIFHYKRKLIAIGNRCQMVQKLKR